MKSLRSCTTAGFALIPLVLTGATTDTLRQDQDLTVNAEQAECQGGKKPAGQAHFHDKLDAALQGDAEKMAQLGIPKNVQTEDDFIEVKDTCNNDKPVQASVVIRTPPPNAVVDEKFRCVPSSCADITNDQGIGKPIGIDAGDIQDGEKLLMRICQVGTNGDRELCNTSHLDVTEAPSG